MKKFVAVAMSGGVDSSVAAALLKKQGHEVIGLTMCFNLAEKDGRRPSCCGLTGIEDARRVCQKLGIRHYVINLDKDFKRDVIEDFYQEYLNGRTPNPCVRCNQFIKFGILLKKSLNLGAQFLATGHYAKIVESKQGYFLKKAKDLKKDQSYFLYRLNQTQLKKIIFPLGNFTKLRIREMAKDFGLNVAEKKDSQEICFLPDGKPGDLIKSRDLKKVKPGQIVDKQGNLLGEHKGMPFYTIGQRHGIGVAKAYPLYVSQMDVKNNQIVVGKRKDVYKKGFIIKERHFLGKPFKKKIEIKVRIRYNHKEMPAIVSLDKKGFKVIFKTPQFAITPGQSAVFYDKDIVLGGGIIQKVID
ncbi:MAG: tRNA 2-thiouridine(34) synthase MnmA [Candidatus Omnitrophota bacterium]